MLRRSERKGSAKVLKEKLKVRPIRSEGKENDLRSAAAQTSHLRGRYVGTSCQPFER
jgi:hypothetical protein